MDTTKPKPISNTMDISPRKMALIASIAYLIICPAAIFAEFFSRQTLFVQGDIAATFHNIKDSQMKFRLGICCFLIDQVCDLLVAWALYVFLRKVNKNISLLTAWFRLIYIAIFGIATLNLVNIVRLVDGAEIHLQAFQPIQLHTLVTQSMYSFGDGWAIAFVFFGIHLILLGYLTYKSPIIPKILGICLVLGGIAYVIDSSAKFILSNYENYRTMFEIGVAVPSMIGELGLAFWLLIKGGKTDVASYNKFS